MKKTAVLWIFLCTCERVCPLAFNLLFYNVPRARKRWKWQWMTMLDKTAAKQCLSVLTNGSCEHPHKNAEIYLYMKTHRNKLAVKINVDWNGLTLRYESSSMPRATSNLIYPENSTFGIFFPPLAREHFEILRDQTDSARSIEFAWGGVGWSGSVHGRARDGLISINFIYQHLRNSARNKFHARLFHILADRRGLRMCLFTRKVKDRPRWGWKGWKGMARKRGQAE